jgi:hypothetical protein
MKKATALSVAVTTVIYMLCGCVGYAAFGADALNNLLTGFGFYEPFWLLDVANAAVVVHLVGTYQVLSPNQSSPMSSGAPEQHGRAVRSSAPTTSASGPSRSPRARFGSRGARCTCA